MTARRHHTGISREGRCERGCYRPLQLPSQLRPLWSHQLLRQPRVFAVFRRVVSEAIEMLSPTLTLERLLLPISLAVPAESRTDDI